MKISNKIVDRGTKFYLIFPPCKKFFSIRYLKFVNREKLVFENYLIQVAIQVTLRRNLREKKKQNLCKVSIRRRPSVSKKYWTHLVEEKKDQSDSPD